eukprot:3615867-Heterocapsa_arctica.AAC.1
MPWPRLRGIVGKIRPPPNRHSLRQRDKQTISEQAVNRPTDRRTEPKQAPSLRESDHEACAERQADNPTDQSNAQRQTLQLTGR